MDEFIREAIRWMGVALVGGCIGSFLNMFIYRWPRNLPINEPKRSFCPKCQTTIPWYRNIPIVTWLLQKGRCAECREGIPVRYLWVEVLTAGLFVLSAYYYSYWGSMVLMMVFISILIAVFFIDLEWMVIPVPMVLVGAFIGCIGGWFVPDVSNLVGEQLWFSGRWMPVVGGLVGFFSLFLMVQIGKLFFGSKKIAFKSPTQWQLKEPQGEEEELALVIGKESVSWSDLFYRSSDCVQIGGGMVRLDGRKGREVGAIELSKHAISLDGVSYELEQLESVSGRATQFTLPQEAMGGGDPPLLGMIGCFVGWAGVLFVVLTSCLLAILTALMGRIGFGKPLPYGPFLVIGAVIWCLGGWKAWVWYQECFN